MNILRKWREKDKDLSETFDTKNWPIVDPVKNTGDEFGTLKNKEVPMPKDSIKVVGRNSIKEPLINSDIMPRKSAKIFAN